MRKLLIILSAIALFSCSKYEDNNGLYLSSKMNRLCDKQWICDDGINKVKFYKNNTSDFSQTKGLKWFFSKNKNSIYFPEYAGLEFDIIKLTNEELILYNNGIKYNFKCE